MLPASLVPAREAVHANQTALDAAGLAQMVFSGMIYGPIAAYLVEAFPAQAFVTLLSRCPITSATGFLVDCCP